MIDLRKIFNSQFRGKMMYGLSFLPDKWYLRLFYLATTGKMIHFKNPVGFNEKLQWLKVNDRHLEYGKLVDKLAVREHIEEVLGAEYLFPLLGYWESFDEIDFETLPNQFVLKCNHDSGSTKIIKDKSALTEEDYAELKSFFERHLSKDFFYAGREYPYKGIKPYIIAEEMMTEETDREKSIEDYKFFCFNGVPKIMFVVTDRSNRCNFDFFDMDFNHLSIKRKNHPHSDKPVKKPVNFEKMKEIATKLSQGKKFVRIDLYEINGKIYFGEYTFFTGGGFQLFYPIEWERRLGDWIDLS